MSIKFEDMIILLKKGPVRVLQLLFTSAEDCAEYQCSALFNPENMHGGNSYSIKHLLCFSIMYLLGYRIISATGSNSQVTTLHNNACDIVWDYTNKTLNKIWSV